MKIELKNLSMTYPNGRQALRNLNLSLEAPSLVGLLGPNGAGKSTLMKLLVAANNVGTTVVVVTHEQDMARRMGKRIILLEEGRVVTDGKPGQGKGGARG